jgi:zinc transporter, ZIP family
MGLLTTAFLYSLAPVSAAAIGAGAVFLRMPKASVRSAVQHFAAGVVFSVAAVELLPEIRKQHNPKEVILGFSLGIVLMLVLRSLTSQWENKESDAGKILPFPMLAATGIDVLLDGVLIGVGLRTGQREGLLLTIALATEFLSLGLVMTLGLLRQRMTRLRTFGLMMGVCLLVVVGAVGGTSILTQFSENAVQIFLSAGLAALLFLATEELLVEAHEVKETPWITASFFLGFILFLALEMTGASGF